MTDGREGRGRLGALVVVGAAVLAMASSARAHEDPPLCNQTGPAIIVGVFRANGSTAVVGAVSECETITYRATLQKATPDDDSICAFSGGTFSLTTPDGVVHTVSTNVPCIGGEGPGEGCDDTVNGISSNAIPYVVNPDDIDDVTGLITATAQYTGGVAHDNTPNTPGVGANTPKSTPVVICDDNDPCTENVCEPTAIGANACSFPPVECVDNDLCTLDQCNPDTGQCTFTPNVPCDDNSLCTSEECNPATGQCVFTPTILCNDNSECTSDACNPATGQCVFTTTVFCNDNDQCTQDSCDPATGDCIFDDTVTPTCNDNNLCTQDSCNPATGTCVNTDTVTPTCNDNNLCTEDSCNPATGTCVNTDTVTPTCNDNDLCTEDSCNPATGTCVFDDTVTPTCNDNSECTEDSCDPATGECVFTQGPPCNDNSECTTDVCNPATGTCVFTPDAPCNDNNLCTNDGCDPATGNCLFLPNIDCNDNSVCTNEACNPATGMCVVTPALDCNDNNICTDDRCNPVTGCFNVPNDNPACLEGNHFQCYEIKPFAFARRTATVTDRYGTGSVSIRIPNRLCAPADKRGEDPTAPQDPEHLMAYPSLSAPVRQPNQEVVNQFGTLKLDVVRRVHLLVPTSKSLISQPPPLQDPGNHFQCYLVRRSQGEPRFHPIRGVSIVDQFGSHAMDLLRPRHLCVPANKNNEDPTAPQSPGNLLCYKARHRVRFGEREPFMTNQFLSAREKLIRRMEFCVPTAFVGEGSPSSAFVD